MYVFVKEGGILRFLNKLSTEILNPKERRSIKFIIYMKREKMYQISWLTPKSTAVSTENFINFLTILT